MAFMLIRGGNPPKENLVETDIGVEDLSLIVENLRLIQMIMESTLTRSLAFCINGKIVYYHYCKNGYLYKSVGEVNTFR
jgi:hypothetical protein